MTVAAAARIIQLIIAPTIMITASAILTSGILSHYGAINDRVRTMIAERLGLLRDVATGSLAAPLEALVHERLGEIAIQVPQLLRRHQLVHRALITIYGSIAVFISSMFVIALAALANSRAAATASLFVFLAGTALLLAGVFIVSVEIRDSRDALRYEADRVLGLGRETGGVRE
jgi:hypothetical protein